MVYCILAIGPYTNRERLRELELENFILQERERELELENFILQETRERENSTRTLYVLQD